MNQITLISAPDSTLQPYRRNDPSHVTSKEKSMSHSKHSEPEKNSKIPAKGRDRDTNQSLPILFHNNSQKSES